MAIFAQDLWSSAETARCIQPVRALDLASESLESALRTIDRIKDLPSSFKDAREVELETAERAIRTVMAYLGGMQVQA